MRADTQGDISQARGQLGQLLFEFSQIELNRDLLDAIKRTESKTGGLLDGPGGCAADRKAFQCLSCLPQRWNIERTEWGCPTGLGRRGCAEGLAWSCAAGVDSALLCAAL